MIIEDGKFYFIKDEFFEHGTVSDLRKDAGLDWESLYTSIKECNNKA